MQPLPGGRKDHVAHGIEALHRGHFWGTVFGRDAEGRPLALFGRGRLSPFWSGPVLLGSTLPPTNREPDRGGPRLDHFPFEGTGSLSGSTLIGGRVKENRFALWESESPEKRTSPC